MEHDPQWEALVALTREEIPWAGKREPLTAATRILHDLRIDGDDAVEFMEKFFATFHVANVEDFPVHRYFGPEGSAAVPLLIVPVLIAAWFRFVLGRPRVRDDSPPPLTLGMLLEAIRAGRWDTALIEGSGGEAETLSSSRHRQTRNGR